MEQQYSEKRASFRREKAVSIYCTIIIVFSTILTAKPLLALNPNFFFLHLLEKYLCLKVSSPPLVIILMGNFFDFYPIDHTKKMNKVN